MTHKISAASRHALAAVGATVLLAAAPATARAQGEMAPMSHPHAAPFTVGGTDDWTLGVPHVDVNGGLYSVAAKDNMAKVQEGFVSARLQTGLGTEHVQLSVNALFVPKLGGSPELSTVVQYVPTSNEGRGFFSVGAGAISGRWGSDNRVEPWVQATAAFRTPIHEITPFVQVGAPLVSGGRTELLIGIAHPLAPYRFHLP